jgi:hypothetical protein
VISLSKKCRRDQCPVDIVMGLYPALAQTFSDES